MPSTTVAPLTHLHLLPRQRAWQSLPTGSHITVTDGSARVHLCHCLGGSWVALPVLLRAGDSHPLERGGWIEIEAVDGTAQLHLQPPVPWLVLASLRLPLRQAWAWLRSVGRHAALHGSD